MERKTFSVALFLRRARTSKKGLALILVRITKVRIRGNNKAQTFYLFSFRISRWLFAALRDAVH